MSKKKIKKTDFVFIGKDYKSKERAKAKEENLIANGYAVEFQNSKRKFFAKYV